MDLFAPETAELIGLLRQHRVDYMLVSGLAVNLYGYQRTTGDLDIWIQPTTENFLRTLAAIESFGFSMTGMHEQAAIVATEGMTIRVSDGAFVADFMSHISGIRYEEAAPNRHLFDLDGLVVYVIHRNDLVINKLASGRPKDQDDVFSLQRVDAFLKGEKLDSYEIPQPDEAA